MPRLTRALRNLTTVSSRVAAGWSERLRREKGVSTAANLIEAEVERWLTETPLPNVSPRRPRRGGPNRAERGIHSPRRTRTMEGNGKPTARRPAFLKKRPQILSERRWIG